MLSITLRRLVSIVTLLALFLTTPALQAGNGKPSSGRKQTTTTKSGGKTSSTKSTSSKTASNKTASSKVSGKNSGSKTSSTKTASSKTTSSRSSAKTASAKSQSSKRGSESVASARTSRTAKNTADRSTKSTERPVAAKTAASKSRTAKNDDKPVASSKRSNSRSTKSSESESATPERRFTARGNSSVTRNVALNLLAERAPDLAGLLGIQAPERPDSAEAPREVPGGGLRGARVIEATYIDAELDESEDPDHVTAEDVRRLEASQADNINSFYKEFTRYMATLNGDAAVTDNGVDKQSLLEGMMSWLGTRYLFGGMGRNGIDCSAFTGSVYRGLGYKLPRTAAMQWTNGFSIERDNLQFGDLIFFNTRKAVYVSHVGIYLGNGLFTHASSRNGVTISSLNSPYYSTHFIGGRRLDLNDLSSADLPH